MAEQELDKILRHIFSKAREVYQSLQPNQQTLFLGRLEILIEEANRPNSIPVFDSLKARRIREEAGLSKRELVGKLGLNGSKSAYILIAEYEKGARIGTPKKNENSQRYLSWLKEQGYNPYNL